MAAASSSSSSRKRGNDSGLDRDAEEEKDTRFNVPSIWQMTSIDYTPQSIDRQQANKSSVFADRGYGVMSSLCEIFESMAPRKDAITNRVNEFSFPGLINRLDSTFDDSGRKVQLLDETGRLSSSVMEEQIDFMLGVDEKHNLVQTKGLTFSDNDRPFLNGVVANPSLESHEGMLLNSFNTPLQPDSPELVLNPHLNTLKIYAKNYETADYCQTVDRPQTEPASRTSLINRDSLNSVIAEGVSRSRIGSKTPFMAVEPTMNILLNIPLFLIHVVRTTNDYTTTHDKIMNVSTNLQTNFGAFHFVRVVHVVLHFLDASGAEAKFIRENPDRYTNQENVYHLFPSIDYATGRVTFDQSSDNAFGLDNASGIGQMYRSLVRSFRTDSQFLFIETRIAEAKLSSSSQTITDTAKKLFEDTKKRLSTRARQLFGAVNPSAEETQQHFLQHILSNPALVYNGVRRAVGGGVLPQVGSAPVGTSMEFARISPEEEVEWSNKTGIWVMAADLSMGAAITSEACIKAEIDGVWHLSLIAFGCEYEVSGTITRKKIADRVSLRQYILNLRKETKGVCRRHFIGSTKHALGSKRKLELRMDQYAFEEYLKGLKMNFYFNGAYNVLFNNCIMFVEESLYALVREHIESNLEEGSVLLPYTTCVERITNSTDEGIKSIRQLVIDAPSVQINLRSVVNIIHGAFKRPKPITTYERYLNLIAAEKAFEQNESIFQSNLDSRRSKIMDLMKIPLDHVGRTLATDEEILSKYEAWMRDNPQFTPATVVSTQALGTKELEAEQLSNARRLLENVKSQLKLNRAELLVVAHHISNTFGSYDEYLLSQTKKGENTEDPFKKRRAKMAQLQAGIQPNGTFSTPSFTPSANSSIPIPMEDDDAATVGVSTSSVGSVIGSLRTRLSGVFAAAPSTQYKAPDGLIEKFQQFKRSVELIGIQNGKRRFEFQFKEFNDLGLGKKDRELDRLIQEYLDASGFNANSQVQNQQYIKSFPAPVQEIFDIQQTRLVKGQRRIEGFPVLFFRHPVDEVNRILKIIADANNFDSPSVPIPAPAAASSSSSIPQPQPQQPTAQLSGWDIRAVASGMMKNFMDAL